MPGSKKSTAATSKKLAAAPKSSTNAKSASGSAKPAANAKKGPAEPVDDSTTIKPPPPPRNKAPASKKAPAPPKKTVASVASSKENTAPAPSPPDAPDSRRPKARPKPKKDTHQPANDSDAPPSTATISNQTPRLDASAETPNAAANTRPTEPTASNTNTVTGKKNPKGTSPANAPQEEVGSVQSAPANNNSGTNTNQSLGLIDVDALMAKVTAQQAEIEALRRRSGGNQSNDSDITLDKNKSIPRPPVVKNIAQAMQMYDDVADKPTSEYHRIRQSVYLKLISLGVDPETQTYRSLGRTRVTSLANTV
ncbi:hypothetical protein BJ165DRAFT_860404 [Panaeolus papilionaceus]|nr:hypothetical protein BJ165DRAFT_860404 [Panaeolus papilionaceus]